MNRKGSKDHLSPCLRRVYILAVKLIQPCMFLPNFKRQALHLSTPLPESSFLLCIFHSLLRTSASLTLFSSKAGHTRFCLCSNIGSLLHCYSNFKTSIWEGSKRHGPCCPLAPFPSAQWHQHACQLLFFFLTERCH